MRREELITKKKQSAKAQAGVSFQMMALQTQRSHVVKEDARAYALATGGVPAVAAEANLVKAETSKFRSAVRAGKRSVVASELATELEKSQVGS